MRIGIRFSCARAALRFSGVSAWRLAAAGPGRHAGSAMNGIPPAVNPVSSCHKRRFAGHRGGSAVALQRRDGAWRRAVSAALGLVLRGVFAAAGVRGRVEYGYVRGERDVFVA